MGYGGYSEDNRSSRAASKGFYTKSVKEVMNQKVIHNDMDPKNIAIRESRDSQEHPNSVPIILALDVTGSMLSVPAQLVRDGLPHIMSTIIQKGIPDPQLLFLAIGDHEYDRSPLQVAQFESNDELLDKWLTSVFLEEGGGGNAGESYLLAWYLAAYKTATDAFEKRGKKGFLFTIGDEPTLKVVPLYALKNIMGDGQFEDYSAAQLLKKAQETYHVFHLHVSETGTGQRHGTVEGWRELLGENLIVVKSHEDIPKIVAETVLRLSDKQPVTVNEVNTETVPSVKPNEPGVHHNML